mgnify:CR=1 FL=1
MIRGLDTRGLYVEAGKGAEVTGGDGRNDELDSDEDWDTSEWGKEDVESACMALLDEIEKATEPKRHRMATMMLVKLVLKHDTAVDYLDGGMESLLDKGLRMQHHGITLASRNLTLVLSKVAAVHSLAERMSAMSAVIKCIKCTNAVLSLCSCNMICGAFACNGMFSLLAVNGFFSFLSLNSAFSILSVNSFLAVGCKQGFFEICFDGEASKMWTILLLLAYQNKHQTNEYYKPHGYL